jgi:hypothetical protein
MRQDATGCDGFTLFGDGIGPDGCPGEQASVWLQRDPVAASPMSWVASPCAKSSRRLDREVGRHLGAFILVERGSQHIQPNRNLGMVAPEEDLRRGLRQLPQRPFRRGLEQPISFETGTSRARANRLSPAPEQR